MSDTVSAPMPPLVEHAGRIVQAYVAHNALPPAEISGLLRAVHTALVTLGQPAAMPESRKADPAEVRRSITRAHLISFEDGKPYKTLRRHLTLRGLTPEAYREKWGLPRDYPMTSASYSEQRSQLAHALGLGQQRRKDHRPAPAPALSEAA